MNDTIPEQMRAFARLIREGCKLLPRQTEGELFWIRDNGEPMASCALGAAYHAHYKVIPSQFDDDDELCTLVDNFPFLRASTNPGKTLETWANRIVRWNDDCHWPREKIADRLIAIARQVEKKHVYLVHS